MASRPDIAFEQLLHELRREGFTLSPTDYIEFTAIFNQFTGAREEFKYYIAPIICRNRDQQSAFYRIYDTHTTLTRDLDRGHAKSADAPAVAPIPPGLINAFMRFAAKQYYVWLLFILVVSVILRLLPLMHQKKIMGPVYADTPDTIAHYSNPEPTGHGRIFVAKEYKHPAAGIPEVHSRILPQGPPIERVNTVTASAFARLLVLGLTGLALSLSVFPLRRSSLRPNLDLDSSVGDDAPIDIPFQPKDHLIQHLPVLARVARDLLQPVPTDVYQLDIDSTITASIRAYGLLTPVHVNVHRRPEYLVLIDNSHPVRAHLFRYLAQTLGRQSVPLDYYFYAAGEDLYYPDESATPINGYGLRQRHGDATLILPDSDPGWNPLDPGLIDSAGHTPFIPEPLFAPFDFGPILSLPSAAAAQAFLHDEDLFQWLCALAIYPTVQWEVLLSIGAAALQQRNALHKLNLANLLRLTRIGWLCKKTIPTKIRLELLRQLGLHEELAARQAILELLKEADDPDQIELLSQTQSFILYAFDTRANKRHEADARKFMSFWNRRRIPDLATVLYLQNTDREWDTPLRSPEDPAQSVAADRFINELLALRVIHNPRMRAFFRNLGYSFFFILALLWLFKDPIQPTKINDALDLIENDYPTHPQPVTVRIPVNACLKIMLPANRVLVTLDNYDNNRYSQLLTLAGSDNSAGSTDANSGSTDTLTATFADITMAGKPADSPAFRIILNNDLTIDNPDKEYFPNYILQLRGDDCDVRLPDIKPVQSKPLPNAIQQ